MFPMILSLRIYRTNNWWGGCLEHLTASHQGCTFCELASMLWWTSWWCCILCVIHHPTSSSNGLPGSLRIKSLIWSLFVLHLGWIAIFSHLLRKSSVTYCFFLHFPFTILRISNAVPHHELCLSLRFLKFTSWFLF